MNTGLDIRKIKSGFQKKTYCHYWGGEKHRELRLFFSRLADRKGIAFISPALPSIWRPTVKLKSTAIKHFWCLSAYGYITFGHGMFMSWRSRKRRKVRYARAGQSYWFGCHVWTHLYDQQLTSPVMCVILSIFQLFVLAEQPTSIYLLGTCGDHDDSRDCLIMMLSVLLPPFWSTTGKCPLVNTYLVRFNHQ